MIKVQSFLYLKKESPLAFFSFFLLVGYVLLAVMAQLGWLATDATATNMNLSYQPPSTIHWLGTDFLGRDVFARAVQGCKVAMLVGFFAASISTGIGLVLGAIAGFFGGILDDLVVWFYSTLESIPYILLISAFAFILGQGIENLYLALGITGWVKMCRLTRGEFLKHRNRDYVSAAQALGVAPLSVAFKHIMPNVLHLAYIQFSLTFVFAIKIEVILSYLGLGVEPGTPSWGLMINDAKAELTRGVWWNLFAASAFMFVLILSVNLLSDGLRQRLDPRTIKPRP